MNYVEVEFFLEPLVEAREVLLAELSEMEFESFVETENGLKAYIREIDFADALIENLAVSRLPGFRVSHHITKIPEQNWNAEWEKNFQPVEVAQRLLIRATFHKPVHGFNHEIVIEPQMSFGTGHHATTYLMCQQMLEMTWNDKQVLDMGAGTGILAILAMKLGAQKSEAIDVDEWSVRNIETNIALNNTHGITVRHSDASYLKISPGKFDIILANINRNILLADFEIYNQSLKHGGEILLSGFYDSDSEMLLKEAGDGFTFLAKKLRDDWCMLHLRKL